MQTQVGTTKPELTEYEQDMVIATARFNKIKRLEWSRRNLGLSDDVSGVELTQEEIDQAIEKASRVKAAKLYFDQLASENRHKESLRASMLQSEWTASRFYQLMKERSDIAGKPLIVDDRNKRLIEALCYKVSGSGRYAGMGLSPDKGLIIRGAPGLGKSYLVGLIADNPIAPIQIITMHEIVRSVLDTGDFKGLKFGSHTFVYIDDVGTEYDNGGKTVHYGSEINWFKNWFEGFYAKSKDHVWRLIFSTNDNFDLLERKYGFRVRDRIAEVCDVLDVSGKSFRR